MTTEEPTRKWGCLLTAAAPAPGKAVTMEDRRRMKDVFPFRQGWRRAGDCHLGRRAGRPRLITARSRHG